MPAGVAVGGDPVADGGVPVRGGIPCNGDIIPVLGAPEKAAPPTSKRCGVDALTCPPRFMVVGAVVKELA
jgi:hypothetical protein